MKKTFAEVFYALKYNHSLKGMNISDAPQLILALVLMGMLAGAGALSLSKFQASTTAGTAEYLAIGNATKGIGDFATQMPTIGIIAGVAILISLVVGAFYLGNKNR